MQELNDELKQLHLKTQAEVRTMMIAVTAILGLYSYYKVSYFLHKQ
jgi:hypothetical protein